MGSGGFGVLDQGSPTHMNRDKSLKLCVIGMLLPGTFLFIWKFNKKNI